ncbi:MAG: ankyrin repeat domain-containing protein [Bacteroidota bacterium]
MNKIVVDKATPKSILGRHLHLILCWLLGLSGTIQAAGPAQQLDDTLPRHDVQPITQEAYLNSEDEHKVAASVPLPLDQLLISANGQCLYTTIIMGYLLPVRKNSAKLAARIAQLFGCPPAYYLNQLHQILQNPPHYPTSLHSTAFSTLVTAFMARMQIKKGTCGGPQEIQTIANKLKVNMPAHSPDPSTPTNWVASDLTEPYGANADITIHIVQDRVDPVEVFTQTGKVSAEDSPYYQHYRLKHTLYPSIPVPVVPSKQPPIPYRIGSQQKSSMQSYSVEWFEAAKTGDIKLLVAFYNNYNIIVNTRNKYKDTALLLSAQQGHLDCLKFLRQQGADINARNENGYTALHWSAKQDHANCVKYLVKQGADIHAKNLGKKTALLLGAEKGHLEIVKYLVEQGADINATDKYGDNALILSVQLGHQERVKFLVEKGADINIRDKNGDTALLFSAKKGHLDMVKCLVEQSADINARVDDGYTALLWSARMGHLGCLKFLLQQGADINAKVDDGYTALLWSARMGHLDCLKFLLQQDADINVRNKWYEETALLLSSCYGYLDCVKSLVEKGADINAQDKWGNTALILTAQKGHLDCVKFLVQQGADITIKNKYGKTYRDYF